MFCLFAAHCHNIIYLVLSTGIESYFEDSVCIGASNFVLRFCAYTIVISQVGMMGRPPQGHNGSFGDHSKK